MIDFLAGSREYVHELLADVHDIVQTNSELAVKIPLIVRSPWMASSVGKTTFALVEMVDVVSFSHTHAKQRPHCTLHVQ